MLSVSCGAERDLKFAARVMRERGLDPVPTSSTKDENERWLCAIECFPWGAVIFALDKREQDGATIVAEGAIDPGCGLFGVPSVEELQAEVPWYGQMARELSAPVVGSEERPAAVPQVPLVEHRLSVVRLDFEAIAVLVGAVCKRRVWPIAAGEQSAEVGDIVLRDHFERSRYGFIGLKSNRGRRRPAVKAVCMLRARTGSVSQPGARPRVRHRFEAYFLVPKAHPALCGLDAKAVSGPGNYVSRVRCKLTVPLDRVVHAIARLIDEAA